MFRLLGSIAGLWTMVLLGSPVPMHSCPSHAEHLSHQEHAEKGHAAHEHGTAPPETSCECVDCWTTHVPLTLDRTAVLISAVSPWPVPAYQEPVCEAYVSNSEHVLPFANAPPLT